MGKLFLVKESKNFNMLSSKFGNLDKEVDEITKKNERLNELLKKQNWLLK